MGWVRSAWVVSVAVCASGLVAALKAPQDRMPPPAPTAPAHREVVRRSAGADVGVAIIDRNPFRENRRPPGPRYSVRPPPPPPPEPEPPPPPPIPRPAWTLTAILWSQDPVAIFEGATDDGTSLLLATGDSVPSPEGVLAVAQIEPDSVVLAHPDTTWVFKIVAPWKGAGDA